MLAPVGHQMKFRDKKLKLLKLLYNKRFDGKYYDVLELLNSPETNYTEALKMGKSLDEEGLIDLAASKDNVSAMINSYGIEFIEDDLSDPQIHSPNNSFTETEKEILKEKLDEFNHRLTKIELGQQITYDDLTARIEELKELLEVLNKKNWSSIFKGTLLEYGLGKIYDEVSELLVDTFKDNNLLQ